MSLDQLTQAAIALPEDQRRGLLHALRDTLSPEEYDEAEVLDPAFLAELVGRDEDLRSGRVVGHTREEMRAVARDRGAMER